MKYLLSLLALIALTASLPTYAIPREKAWTTHPLCRKDTVKCANIHIYYYGSAEAYKVSIKAKTDCHAPKASGSGTVKISKFSAGDGLDVLPRNIDWIVPLGCNYHADARKGMLTGNDGIIEFEINNLSKDKRYRVNVKTKKVINRN